MIAAIYAETGDVMNRLPIRAAFVCAVSLSVAFASGACSPSEQPPVSSAAAQVRCDTFKIAQSLDGDTLTVSLDTDLPDFTDVMMSVSRSYFEKNNSDDYSRNYFEEKSTVGRWRQPRQIKVSHDIFKASLQEHQGKMSKAGIAGEIDRLGTDVVINFTVPVNQTNAAFGKGNANLTGAATTTSGSWRIIKAEAREPYPLDGKGAVGPQWGNWNALVEGGHINSQGRHR